MLNSPMLSIFQHFHAIPLLSPLISLHSKWRLTGFSRRFTPKNPVRLHNPFGELPRWGDKNVLPLNLIAFPIGEGGPRQRRSGAFANSALETIFPPLFHTASTLSGSLRSPPSPRGEGFVSGIPLPPSNLRPFGAPPSIGRRVYPREPLPLEGAAERSEAGLASFFAAKPPPLCLPHRGRGTAQRWIGCSRKRRT